MSDFKVVLILSVAVAACGTGNGGNDGNGNVDAAAQRGFTLTVQDAKLRHRIGTLPPPANVIFADVGISLANMSESKPLPVNATTFSLQTAAALIFQTSARSSLLMPPCPDVSVAASGQVSCRLAFEIPMTEMPAKINYSDMMGRMASAAISNLTPLPPQSCLDWSQGDFVECQRCAHNSETMGACSQAGAALSACKAEYMSNCVDSMHPWYCPQIKSGCTASAACQSALRDFDACLYMACETVCQ